jgi:hypothetical protein
MNSPEQDKKIDQTDNQRDPYRARPEDFPVSEPNEIAARTQPFHGQCGDSTREYNKLLAIRGSKAGKSHPTGRGADLPTSIDKASTPHAASR